MFQHVVARTIDGLKPFTDPKLAEWVWKRMRNSFPDAVAAVLMPDHPHLIVERRPNVVQELGALLSGISRHASQRRLWQPIPVPREIPDFVTCSGRSATCCSIRVGRGSPPTRWSGHGRLTAG